MPFRKFAAAQIIDAHVGAEPASIRKNSHRAVFNYEAREGYLYFRSRAISSRCNDNFDMFPAEEIKKSYLTFIGKPVFVNHNNEDHKRARGVIIDAALHEDTNPDGSPDTWVEVLHELDAKTYPRLAKAILKGEIDRTSMGTDVQISKCSVCHNEASTPMEYCEHIPGKKGKKIVTLDPRTGARDVKLCFEICSGLSFFENSVLVEQPADPTAFFLGPVEHGGGLESLGVSKTASSKPADPTFYWRQTQAQTSGPAMGRTASKKEPVVDFSYEYTSWLVREAVRIDDDSLDPVVAAVRADTPADTKYWHELGDIQPSSSFDAYMRRQAQLNDPAPDAPLVRPAKRQHAVTGKDLPYSKKENADWAKQTRSHSASWRARNPLSHHNIVDHFNEATDDEKHNGMNWYADAHETSKTLAKGTGTPEHVMAGLVSNYSPQTHWATNVITAAKSARLKVGLGGKGNDHGFSQFPESTPKGKPHPKAGQQRGIMASTSQKTAAESLLKGTDDEEADKQSGSHYEKVLKGPKTKAFARLIHRGGDDHTAVVDRHAYSVAAGARASDAAYGHSGLGGAKKYKEVEKMYQDAAKHLSKQHGITIHPHQVQATTWLVRQRLNEQGDKELHKKGRTSAVAAQRSIGEMHQYLGEHHPEASLQMPGTGYSKETGLVDQQKESSLFHQGLNELRSPEKVDTLRVESCPICGGTAFDGKQCVVCNYQSPGSLFGDPDTSKARELDGLREQADPETGLPGGDDEFAEDQALAGDDGTDQPVLGCENCGAEFDPSEPLTVGEEPVPGQQEEQEQADSGQPAAGDLCPVCESGLVNPIDNSDPSEAPEMDEGSDEPDPDDEDFEEDDEDQEPEEDEEDEDSDFPPKKKDKDDKTK